MTIASEITRINNNIAAAYTALSNKGATLPATQNSANLATTVGSVSGDITTTTFYLNDKMRVEDGAIYPNTNGVNSYITTNYNISFTPAQWQKELIIQVHIKTPSTLGNQWIMSNGSDWNNGIGFTLNSEINYAFWACLGQSNRSYVTLNGTTVPQTNTEYWVRLYKPNTENEAHDTLLQISTDGVHWNTEASQSIANIVSDYTTTGNIRLFNLNGSNTYFSGGIYLDGDTFISIDGEKVWYLIKLGVI